MTTSTTLPSPWNTLQSDLAGFFTARRRGLLAPEHLLIDRSGTEFGRLAPDGSGGTRLTAGALEASIEHAAKTGYRIRSGDVTLLAATLEGRSANISRIECAEQTYSARVSLFRNTAVGYVEGVEVIRLTGGFAGHGYEAVFDINTGGALLVAMILLYHTSTLRRGVYRT